MTQAFNLSQLANNLNSSGQLDATDGLTGLVPLANGGTGATNTVNAITAGSGISTSVSGQTVTINATGSGTVTSVATGNGLSGGTITTSGTLTIAAPTAGSVGSYVWADYYQNGAGTAFGDNRSVGAGNNQYQGIIQYDQTDANWQTGSGVISGTWKWLGLPLSTNGHHYYSLAVRVS